MTSNRRIVSEQVRTSLPAPLWDNEQLVESGVVGRRWLKTINMIKHEGGSFEAPRVQPSYWVMLFIFCYLPLVCRFGLPSVWPFIHRTFWLNIFNCNSSPAASPTTTSNPSGVMRCMGCSWILMAPINHLFVWAALSSSYCWVSEYTEPPSSCPVR